MPGCLGHNQQLSENLDSFQTIMSKYSPTDTEGDLEKQDYKQEFIQQENNVLRPPYSMGIQLVK